MVTGDQLSDSSVLIMRNLEMFLQNLRHQMLWILETDISTYELEYIPDAFR